MNDFDRTAVNTMLASAPGATVSLSSCPVPSMSASPDLAVIVPTYNEGSNVPILVQKLDAALRGIAWEAIFVDDDSRDDTLEQLGRISRLDPRIRYLHRIGRRGLASAVVEGMLATNAPFLAVIDGDLQHDETRLPMMLSLLQAGACDIVVGSRYTRGGGIGEWTESRRLISLAATRISQLMLPTPLSDPMSGFFMVTRPIFMRAVRNLSNEGYKILLDILLSSPERPRIQELPYVFRPRVKGESKLDPAVVIDFFFLLIDKLVGHIIPARFVLFGAVGAAGMVVHMAVLALSLALALSFTVGQALATLLAMTFNFFLNNTLTYRDRRLAGFWPLVRGLVSFWLICGIGAVSNVGVATILFEQRYTWWLSALGGILVGVVWNYAMTSMFTWRR